MVEKKKISVYLEPKVYVDFAKKVLDEKGKLALSETVEELIREYLKRR